MNCERYQEKILGALASGETLPIGEIAAHLRACAGCREFYEAKRQLLVAIDASVRAMVNEDVPASLLPRVRTRMEAASARQMGWRPRWQMGIAAALLLALTFAVMWHRPEQNSARTSPASVATPESTAAVAEPNARGGEKHLVQKKGSVLRKVARPIIGPSEQRIEVIVLPEEREAFAKFVAELPKQEEAAAVLTRPASEAGNPSVEIALLQIRELKVEPLEPSEEK